MKQNWNRESVMEVLDRKKREIVNRFSVKAIGIFGSYATGKATPGSDLDVLVEFIDPTYDNYMDLKFFLEETFGIPVDLVLADSIKPRIRPIIEREALYA